MKRDDWLIALLVLLLIWKSKQGESVNVNADATAYQDPETGEWIPIDPVRVN